MRNEDQSNTGSDGLNQSASLSARDDYDVIPAGAQTSASGNTLTGIGTVSGKAGADGLGSGNAQLVSITGAGGTDSDPSGGQFQVEGRYGSLKIDSDGDYTYVRNAGSPDGVTDTFTYAIANKSGQQDTARLAIRIEGEKQDLAQAQRITAGPDGIVTLPAGVSFSNVRVVGRDLVIDMPDGTQMIIVDGAVFVPQLVFGGVEVPATNLAALLIDSEPQPAAGVPQSSGGNFEVPVGPLDPGVPLGDLIPPTELDYTPPDYEEVGEFFRDRQPEILIQTPDQPVGAVNATASVDEGALPNRGSEPEGSRSTSTAESTSGTIVYTSPDGPNVITINGVVAVLGAVIDGTYGTMTITSIADGAIGYTYLLLDNTSGDTTHDDFLVVITDDDGDTDSATLVVSIIDDTPDARDDTDSLGEDAISTDGNVMTGTGTTSGATGADTVGADNAEVQNDGTYALDYGTLVINADGSYVYTLYTAAQNATAYAAVQALNNGQTLVEDFLYTLVDGDGDTDSATLTITIVGSTDNRPPVVSPASVAVSEEGTTGGVADGNGIPDASADTTDSATANGTLTVSDPNGDALTLTLGIPTGSFTSHGVPVTWTLSGNGQILTGSAGETTVITVTINNAGQYTVTLADQFDHASPEGEDAFNIVVPVSVSDGLLSTPTSITIQVEDDMPVITGEVSAGASVTLDETDAGDGPVWAGPISATSIGSVIAAPFAYGADGEGPEPVYALVLNGTDSGIKTAVGDYPITLSILGNTITGSYNDGGDKVAFTVTIDPATGQVTMTQFVPLEHLVDGTTPEAYNDPLDLGDLVSASVTYEDFDSDSVTAIAPIGDNLVFRDDGPAVDVVVSPPQGEGDQGYPILQTGDEGTEGDGSTTASTSADFSGSFSLVVDGGADGVAGDPAIDYSFNLLSSVSGLTSHGAAINLYIVDGKVVGSTAGVAPASATDASVVFAIAVDALGVVTLTQYQQIDHPIADDPDASDAPFDDQISSLGSELVELVASATVTDNDDDSDSDSASLDLGGLIRFADDGPSIIGEADVNSSVTLDETDGANPVSSGDPIIVTSAAPIIVADVDYGADSEGVAAVYGLTLAGGVESLASGLQTAAGDHAITLNQTNATTITGTYNDGGVKTAFTVVINSDGSLTVTQFTALEHLVDGSSADAFNDALDLTDGEGGSLIDATATYSDFDGDTVIASVGIGSAITFLDDGPSLNTRATSLVEVDEDELPAGITDGDLVTTTDSGSLGALVDFGGDGAGSFSFDLDGDSLPALTSGGAPVSYAVSADGLTLIAYTGANPAANQVFTVTITDAASGAYTVSLLAQIDHLPNDPANDDNQVLDINLSTAIIATDADGDFVRLTQGVTLRVEDDIPVQVAGNANGAVGEDALVPDGNPDGDGLTTVATGDLSSLVEFGADQPGSFKFDAGALASLTTQALRSGGTLLNYTVSADGLTLTAHTGANAGTGNVFTVVLESDGSYTFTLLDQLDHTGANLSGSGDNQVKTIDLSGVVVATDADNDAIALNGGFVISVEDDIPVQVAGNANGAVGEDALIPDGNPDGDGLTTVATGDLSSLVEFGADQPGSFKFDAGALASLTTQALRSGGTLLNYTVSADGLTLTAHTGANAGTGNVFTVVLESDGSYTFTLLDQLDHTGANLSGSGDNQVKTIDLSGVVVATDADNDAIALNGGFVISVEDDIPVQVAGNANGAVGEDALIPDGNPDGDGLTTVATGDLSSLVEFGADQPGSFKFDAGALASLTTQALRSGGTLLNYTVSADGLTLTAHTGANAGTGNVFTVVLESDGSYTFTLLDQLDHTGANLSGSGDNQVKTIDLSGVVVATDADNDAIALNGGFVISVEDDIPVQVAGNANGAVGEDALVPDGNPDGDGLTTVATGDLSSLVEFGADQPGSFKFDAGALASLTTQALRSGGTLLNYTVSADGLTLTAHTGANAGTGNVFTVVLESDGSYTFTLLDQLDHTGANLSGSGDNQVKTIDLSGVVVATDADNDAIALNGGFVISVEDDIPVQVAGNANGAVGEDALIPDGNPDGDGLTTVATGDLSSLVEFGADQPGSFKFDAGALASLTTQALRSGGTLLNYTVSADGLTLTAHTGANAGTGNVFTVVLESDGSYTFTLLDQLDHTGANLSGSGDNQVKTIDLSGVVVATDADNDAIALNGGFVISVEDDIPVQVAGNANGAVGEDALIPDGNPDGDGLTTVATGDLSSLVEFGADQPGSFKFDAGALASLTTQALRSGGTLLNYTVSADGLTLTAHTGANAGTGNVFTVVLESDGSYTFTLLDQLDHTGANLSGSGDNQVKTIDLSGVVVATDADNDAIALNGGFVISVEDDIPVGKVGDGGTTVDEDELPGGITDGDAVLTSATGSLGNITSFGADQPGRFSFDLTGALLPSITAGGLPVTYAVTNGGLTLVAYTGANPALGQVFTVTITNAVTGAYTFTLLDAIDHLGPLVSGSGDNEIISLDLSTAVLATDADNDSIHLSSGFVVTVEDDIPVTFTPEAAVLVNNASGFDTGALDFGDVDGLIDNFGADGGKAIFVAAGLPTTLKSGGVALFYTISADGQTLTANAGEGGPLVFTATISGSTYTIDMNAALDSFVDIQFTDAAFDFIGGNKGWFGIVPNGQVDAPVNDNSNDLLITPNNGSSINTSGILGGVGGGQSLGAGETFRVDYVIDLQGSPPNNFVAGAANGATFDGHYTTNGATIGFRQSGGTTLKFTASDDPDGNNVVGEAGNNVDVITGITLAYRVDIDGVTTTASSGLLAVTAVAQTYTAFAGETYEQTFTYYLAADGKSVIVEDISGGSGNSGPPDTVVGVFTASGYNSLNVEYVSGETIKFQGFGAAVQSVDPVLFNIPVSIVDGDGDTVAGTAIAVTANAPPVVLDTNHDGKIDYLSAEAGVLYDINGDGSLDQTAWVAGGDSILFRDADGNGTVSDASEFVFGGNGVTDMEALHAQYGEQLDASDADFTQFGLWNDANSNGQVDAGEVQSLADAGVTGIGLVSDGVDASYAGGDISVAGSASYTYVNDNGDQAEGRVDDAAFAYRAGSSDFDQRLAANWSNVGVVAAAVAAAGLAQAQASAKGGRRDDDASEDNAKADRGTAVPQVAPVADDAGTNHSLIGSETRVAVNDEGPAETSSSSAATAELKGLGDVSPQVAQPLAVDEVDDGGSVTDNASSMVDIAPAIVMAEAAARVVADNDRGHADDGKVEKLVAEAIDKGGDIDSLLAHLPNAPGVASGNGHAVPAWDGGHIGGFTPQVASTIAIEAMMLHHDAAPAA